ncbi:MAG: sigma-70 family RNA polymerase sigma factor [Eubacteriales bacterium]|nr:sigma-70 family RNA polymerase sigma factor [Eubacteriales bacterium]
MEPVKDDAALYQEYADQVMKFLLCLTGSYDLAEELTQETFYQAYKSIHRYDGSCKLSVWLCQIAKHLYYDHLKKQKHAAPVPFEDAAEGAAADGTPEEDLLAREKMRSLYRAVHRLREPYREVLILRLYMGLPFREIGEVFGGKTESWARTTFYRGKLQVKEDMMQYENSV